MTSHAAVVTRGMGKPCIVGCECLQVDLEGGWCAVNGRTIKEGEDISIDGATGSVYYGTLEIVRPDLDDLPEARKFLS